MQWLNQELIDELLMHCHRDNWFPGLLLAGNLLFSDCWLIVWERDLLQAWGSSKYIVFLIFLSIDKDSCWAHKVVVLEYLLSHHEVVVLEHFSNAHRLSIPLESGAVKQAKYSGEIKAFDLFTVFTTQVTKLNDIFHESLWEELTYWQSS